MARNFILGIVVGAAVGAAVGLVYAPKPGSGTRLDLTATGRNAAEAVKRSASEIVGRLAEKEEPVKQSI